jgi:hypothetical protein
MIEFKKIPPITQVIGGANIISYYGVIIETMLEG